MSLETALAENTAALKLVADLLARLQSTPASAPLPSPIPVPTEDLGSRKAVAIALPEEAPKAEVAAPAAETLDYVKDVKPVLLVAAKKCRPELTAILASHGVKSGVDLEPASYADVLAAVQAALAKAEA